VLRRTLVAPVVLAFLALAGAAASAPRAVPQRIVSLSPTLTEDLFAIGAGKQVVAVDNDSDYPKAALAKRSKLSGFTPNAEAIAGYKPDLVVVSYNPKDIVSALRKLGVRVLELDAPTTLDEAYADLDQLGTVTGHREAAGALVKRMKARIASLVSSVQHARGLSVYHEEGPSLYSATSKTFIGRIYALFGLRNIADAADASGSGYPQLSAEYVISANPDLIVLADTVCCAQTPATVAARPGWSQIRAVKTGSIVRIDDSIASRWGPRIVNFARAVASALSRLQ
jgi:iron complex transport system substrate-binding protein